MKRNNCNNSDSKFERSSERINDKGVTASLLCIYEIAIRDAQ